MSFHHLDHYAHVDSPLTRVAPVARLIGTVALAVAAALLPLGSWGALAAMLGVVALLAAAARVPAAVLLARMAPPMAFVLVVSAFVVVLAPGQKVASLGPLSVTDAGLLRFGSAIGRAAVALGGAVLLVSTTRFPEVVDSLRELRLPAVVTTSLGLAYRFLYVLTDEVEQVRRAARSRNAAAGSAPRRRLMLGITAAALTRSLARSERIHRAMLSRGFDGAMPTLQARGIDRRSALAVAALCAVLAVIVVAARV